MSDALATLTIETFERHLNDSFRLAQGNESVAVTLIDAKALGSPEPAAPRRSFSLLFRGPGEPVLPQQVYRLEHDSLGAMEIFVVPVGPDTEGMRYEVIFA